MPYADPERQREASARAFARHQARTRAAVALARRLAAADPPIPGPEARDQARAALAAAEGKPAAPEP